MLNVLPQPVISLASEALNLAYTDDAPPCLWSLFTKCKDFIEDGPRLENISWRIWHRDFHLRASLRHAPKGASSLPQSDSDSELLPSVFSTHKDPEVFRESSCPTPVPSSVARTTCSGTGTVRGVTQVLPAPSADLLIPQQSPINLLPHRRKRLRHSKPAAHIGEMIRQILPQKVPQPSVRRESLSSQKLSFPPMPPALSRQDTDSGVAESVYDIDEAEQERITNAPLLVIPPYSSPETRPKDPSGPRVVIVNATPRPTPPGTPDVSKPPSNEFLPRPVGSSTLAPPAQVPNMMLPEALTTTANTGVVPHPPMVAPLAPSSYAESTATASSDDPPADKSRNGKLFYMPKSSPQSMSPEAKRLMGPPPLPTPNSFKQSNASVDRNSLTSNVPSSFASSNMRAARKGKMAEKRTRSGAGRGKNLAHQAGKTGSSSATKTKVLTTRKSSAPAATAIPKFEDSSSVSSRSRERGPVGVRSSSLAKRSSSKPGATSSTSSNHHRRTGSIHFAVDQAKENDRPAKLPTLTRVATQPLPHAYNRPGALLEQGGLPPQLQQHLAQPLVPPPNGNRRKIVLTSDDCDNSGDSEWESEIDDGEDEDEEEEGADQKGTDQKGESQLSQAAKEAQRQREFFVKLPARSYSNLGERSRSGLLTHLFKPDPALFPADHPYRTSRSHHDLVSKVLAPTQGLYGIGPTFGRPPHRRSPVSPPPSQVRLGTSKSAAALPEMANVNAAVLSGDLPRAYRPRGAPSNVEVSDSGEEEDPDQGIQMSKSLAETKLKALASSRNLSANSKVDDAATPSSTSTQSRSEAQITIQPKSRLMAARALHPINLGYPYNLPTPDPPSSPGAIRQRLVNDLSQSQRQSILHDRMVHEPEAFIIRRRRERVSPEAHEAEQRRQRLARNKSWAADDFHTSGW